MKYKISNKFNKMNECVFCQIVKGASPCYKLHEDDDFIAILNKYPRSYARILIITKQHYNHFWDYPDLGKYMEFSRYVADKLKRALEADYIFLSVKGIDVSHAHLHLIPYGEKIPVLKKNKLTDNIAKEITKKIQNI